LVLPIIAYTLSSTKLEIRAKQFLPGIEGVRGRGRGQEGKGDGRGKWREMTQTLYAHMNKRKKYISNETSRALNLLAKQNTKVHNAIYQNCLA
jgi:hypothetical protein